MKRIAAIGSLFLLACAHQEPVTAPSLAASTGPTIAPCAEVNVHLEDELDAIYDTGKYAEVLKHATAALEACERDTGAAFLDRERVRARHALTLISAGEVERGEAEAQRAYDALEKEVGVVHADTALALRGISSAVGARRDYPRLKELGQKLIAIYEKVGRPKDLAGLLRNHAVTLSRLGEREEAASVGKRSLEFARANFTETSREVAAANGALGEVYRMAGDLEQAEPLLVKALEMLKVAFGAEHPEVASASNNLAAFYHYTKRDLVKAEPLYRQTLEQRRRYAAPRSPNLAQVLLNLGALLCERGDWEEGRALFDEGAAIMEKNGGKDNVELARSRAWLKQIEKKQGRH